MTGYTNTGHNAYSNQHEADLTGREIDARALMRCADRLQATVDAGGADMKEYVAAVKHNQRLWTIFQIAICDEENPLPQDLKMTLLSLSRYVDKVSFRIVTEYLPQKAESLININRIIAVGLAKRQEAELRAAGQAAPTSPDVPPATSFAASV